MRYVVFSDVHGNAYALKKMLNDLKSQSNIDGYIFCGDIAGYYYGQIQVIDVFKKLNNLIIVKGNHDCMLEKAIRDRNCLNELASKYGNSYLKLENLSQDYLDYLKKTPDHKNIIIDNKRIGIFHGIPNNRLNGRYYPDTALDMAQFMEFDVVFLGHTHYRMEKKIGRTRIINPGSLGQPRDGKGCSYCIFDFNAMNCDFKTIDFEYNELIAEIEMNEDADFIKEYLTDILYRK